MNLYKFPIRIKLRPIGLSLTHIVNPKISFPRLNLVMVVSRQDLTFSYLYTPFVFSYKLKIQACWYFHKVILIGEKVVEKFSIASVDLS